MTPTEHYREAEERLETASQAHVNGKRDARDYHLAVAQVHATLATARLNDVGPVIVSAAAEMIDRIKIVDQSESSRGVLFIPEEIVTTEDAGDLTEQLTQAMTKPLTPEEDR